VSKLYVLKFNRKEEKGHHPDYAKGSAPFIFLSNSERSSMKSCRFSRIPEINLCFFSFFLNFFWEVVQTYFYTLKDSPFSKMLYGWFHCTLGDVILTIGSFWLVSAASRNRKWLLKLNRLNFIGFIMVGVVYAVLSEWANVHMFKSWGYNQSMPIIPWVQMGLTPFLQWIVIPPIVILLVRHHLLSDQETTKGREELK